MNINSASFFQALADGDIPILRGPRLTKPVLMGHPDKACGRAQLAYVNTAMRLAAKGGAAGMVTAAVSKHAGHHADAPQGLPARQVAQPPGVGRREPFRGHLSQIVLDVGPVPEHGHPAFRDALFLPGHFDKREAEGYVGPVAPRKVRELPLPGGQGAELHG